MQDQSLPTPLRTKTIEVLEFYYPDPRQESSSGFAANGIIFDEKAGDTLEKNADGTIILRQANGREIEIPPKWLWKERSSRVVKVKD